MDRRNFLKCSAVAAGCATCPGRALAASRAEPRDRLLGILVDTTRCIGCRSCEINCAAANGLPDPEPDDEIAFAHVRDTSPTQRTVVNRFQTTAGEVFVKRQCMHCVKPACATACLTKAMHKTGEGPVIWREDKCMGCRYCMVSCPFDIPKFEYDSPVPHISKCQMCWERTRDGEQPACVENCPMEALTFGDRKTLLHSARQRIIENPDDYVDHIYGEHEVGGTGVLYLAAVPFEELGFRTDLGDTAYPEFTREFLYAVPMMLTLGPVFLLALSRAAQRSGEVAQQREEDDDEPAR